MPQYLAEFECAQCDMVYNTQSNLNRHVKSAHDKLRFQCGICPKDSPKCEP